MEAYITTNIKDICGVIAVILTFLAFFPYLKGILSKQIVPHVFSWIIWSLTTIVVFFAQLVDGGGFGAWVTGLSGLITAIVAFLAYLKKSDDAITRSDWVFFLAALISLPSWYFTSDPLWAVIILTSIDVVAFFPTMRKAFVKPYEEQALLYFIIAVRGLFSIVALYNYSLTTILFPAAITIQCVILIFILHFRRKFVPPQKMFS